MARRPDPKEELPLKPVDLLLLHALADGERHGYALIRELDERTGGAVRLEAGNLYRVVRRLLDDGLLAESGRRPAPDQDDERRRYYAITPYGRRVLAAELSRLQTIVRLAERQGILSPERA
jgi:DNA-binding PadR family transcriptional regulator